MTKTPKWKSRSHKPNIYDKAKLFELQKAAGERLDDLLDYFGLDLKKNSKFYVGKCPIHGGDNDSAFNIFHDGYDTIGNWRCFTHHCEKYFQPSIIGFVRGVLSHNEYGWVGRNDNMVSFRDTVEFLIKFTNKKSLNDFRPNYALLEKKRFSTGVEAIVNKVPEKPLNLTREQIVGSLDVPSLYFSSRGYSEKILSKYDVGDCRTNGKPMNMRAVVPIYDDNHELVIGCTGRSLFEQCPLCESYHNPAHQCPDENMRHIFRKWKNNKGLRADQHLYNYWFAKEHIRKSRVCVLVEGPGDVWKMEEAGIRNCVGLFGSALKDGQRNILDNSGALALIVLTDPDRAGRLCVEEITASCGMTYSIYSPVFSQEDIGETPMSIIKEKYIPYINKISEELQ